MDFLSQATNLTQHDVGKLLAKHPGLLTASLEWKLEPTVRQQRLRSRNCNLVALMHPAEIHFTMP